MGRRRLYPDNAARQSAYRQRAQAKIDEQARRRTQQAGELESAARELQKAIRAAASLRPELRPLLDLSLPDFLRTLAHTLTQSRPTVGHQHLRGGFFRTEW
jgi:hypothetical protein